MTPRRTVRWCVAAAALLLASCVTQHPRLLAPDAGLLERQGERERALAAHPDWELEGRLGVSDGRDSGSGSLEWSQRGADFRFSVHAPVTGKTWMLAGDARHAVLSGLRAQPVEGDSAAALLERELGWQVPVAELVYWVRGMRAAPDGARIRFREDGLPAEIDESGWKVEYLDYDRSREPALPSKVFASRGNYKVRLAIRSWSP